MKEHIKKTLREFVNENSEEKSHISDVRSSKNFFEGDLTAENIYKYYLEQTGDKDEAKELVDKLINKFDELIKKGKK